ncbi:MAG: substrate-binding domain-containing protein [Deltaproteobacteria bacterium]|nr:substrate-binding domain-containing protein [Deltaproteobacteria bacterium]
MTPKILVRILVAAVLAVAWALPALAAQVYPPWVGTPTDGKKFSLRGVNDLADLHGDVVDPQLVVFFAGNQFMVTHELMQAFQKKYPQYQRIYWETLPPGIEAQQIEQGAVIVGSLRIAHKPDVYTRGRGGLLRIQKEKGWFDRMEDYAGNRLAIMVYEGNPKGIKSLQDLGRDDIKVAMPNPKWEGIATPIEKAFRAAGGEDLVTRIMQTKLGAGTTWLTHMHHRQTPISIMQKQSDCGPTWYTEPYFQAMIKNPIGMIEIPDQMNQFVTYTAAKMKDAPHAQAANDFLDFLISQEGQAIYRKYGFLPAAKK